MVFTIAAVVLATIFFFGWIAYYYNTVTYPQDQIGAFLLNVKATTNLDNMRTYLVQAQNQAAPFSGNPAIWPTAYYSWDYLKADIAHAITAIDNYKAKYQGPNDNQYAYQQVVVNTKNAAENLNTRQTDISFVQGWNPYLNPIGLLTWILVFVGVPCVWAAESLVSDYLSERRYKSKYEPKAYRL